MDLGVVGIRQRLSIEFPCPGRVSYVVPEGREWYTVEPFDLFVCLRLIRGCEKDFHIHYPADVLKELGGDLLAVVG